MNGDRWPLSDTASHPLYNLPSCPSSVSSLFSRIPDSDKGKTADIAAPGFNEVVLADDVGGPVHGTNQHAEVASGPVLIIVVLSKTSHFAYRLVKMTPKLAMVRSGPPLSAQRKKGYEFNLGK